jgi:CDP-diacylglycerol--glycerol-3-phosphate 3-phosphatidyltransferase
MNIPNSLTIFRILLIPVFVILLSTRINYGNYLATAVFIIAALTDSLDGYLARKWKQITKLGIILDPLADKLLITAALISLVELKMIPGWIAIIILGREFAVTGLRAVKAEEGVIIPASKLGKIKTISQIIAVVWMLIEQVYLPLGMLDLGIWVMYFAVIITIMSGVEYFYRFKIFQ